MEQGSPAPKILLDIAGRTLVERHLTMLADAGVARVVIVTGFMADSLEAAVAALSPRLSVSFVRNPRYREGSVVSFAEGVGALPDDGDAGAVLLMDGDVLYDARMLDRLIAADPDADAVLLVDRELEPGDEPVKVCFDAAGGIVDFRKRPEHAHVRHGESVGFFRFSPDMLRRLGGRARAYAADARAALEYEEVIRDLILAEPDRFHAEDISDLPWTEIDFPEDVVRARTEILPQLERVS